MSKKKIAPITGALSSIGEAIGQRLLAVDAGIRKNLQLHLLPTENRP